MNVEALACVALVSCSKAKRAHPAPAQDLYVSPLFRKMAAFAQQSCGRWYILSAKHGLLAPSTVIEPYDVTLKGYWRSQRREWASKVFHQLREMELVEPGSRLLWLAGRAYMQDLPGLLKDCEHIDPLRGMTLGRRLAWLNTQLSAVAGKPSGAEGAQ